VILNPKLNEIKITPIMGLDLETTGLYPWMGAEIDLIAITNTQGDTYVIETKNYDVEELKYWFVWMKIGDVKVIGHNIKFDCNFILHCYGICLTNIFCTQIAAQILDNGRQKELRFNLIEVIRRYLGAAYAYDKEEKKELQQSFINPLVRKNILNLPAIRTKQLEYAAEDTQYLIPLYEVLKTRLEIENLQTIAKLEFAVLPVLSKMEVSGILIDKVGWENIIKVWEVDLKTVELKLDEESLRLLDGKRTKFKFGRSRHASTNVTDLFGNVTTIDISADAHINYASSDQLLELWENFGETPPTDSEGKRTVGEDAIETYLTETPESRLSYFIELLLEYRQLNKLVSTYGLSFLHQLDANNRIHTSYTQTRTETGRLSSKEPNLQNIPTNKDKQKDIRKFFTARPGYKLITCDMAGAEVSIAADYSNEPLLLEALQNGADMHSQLASTSFSIIFGQPITISKTGPDITIDGHTYCLNDLRDEHKSVVFAKFYKAGAKRIYQVLAKYINNHADPADRMAIATRISEALDTKLPKLSAYLSSLIEEAKTTGVLISDKLGRKRLFKPTVYGEAANYPIQGTNANALKIALVRLDKYLATTDADARLLMNIHDEVVVEVKEEYAEVVSVMVKQIMSEALSYFLTNIKGGASVAIKDYWQK